MSSWLSGIRSTLCQFTVWSVAPLLKRLSHSTSASLDSEKCNSSRVEKLFSAFWRISTANKTVNASDAFGRPQQVLSELAGYIICATPSTIACWPSTANESHYAHDVRTTTVRELPIPVTGISPIFYH